MDAAIALQASEERLQRALDATGLCLWDFDVPSGNIYLSESWSVRLGGPAVPTATTFAALAQLVPNEEQEGLLGALIASLKTPGVHHRVEHRVRRLDGEYIWNLSEGAVISRSPEGRALRMVGTNRDTTAERGARDKQRALEAQLREAQKIEAIGTLAAGIAHDFNNILASILGNAMLAREMLAPTHAAAKNLKQIQRSATRAKLLVRQILMFARREASEMSCRPLAPIIEDVQSMLRATLPATVDLVLDIADRSPCCLVDAGKIHQVIVNLVTNAWHALPRGMGTVTIGLDRHMAEPRPTTLVDGELAHLWVRDDGMGMDAATQARLFEPFFTTKPVGTGTGLGLAVAQGIVNEHNGAVMVQSAPGAGSTFHVYLPLAEAESSWPISGWSLLPKRHVGRQEHILYVDDDEAIVTLAASLLERAGYRSTCVGSAHEALAALNELPGAFDLAISDFNMPHVSGLQFAREASALRPGLTVGIISGFLSDTERTELVNVGVKGFLQKEDMVMELGRFVQRLMNDKHTEKLSEIGDAF